MTGNFLSLFGRNPAVLSVLSAIFFFLAPPLFSAEPSAVRPTQFDAVIEKVAAEYSLNPAFIRAIIWRESRFRANARGKYGEIGLMQLKMSTVRDWAKAHNKSVPSRSAVYQAELNIRIGVWRIDWALRNWENYPDQVAMALCEYNAGRTRLVRQYVHYNGNTERLLRNFPSAAYAKSILTKFEEYSREGDSGYQLALQP